jgi:ParB/RepB/Spo0J family partition protein
MTVKKSGIVGTKPSGRDTQSILAAASKLPSFQFNKRSGLIAPRNPDASNDAESDPDSALSAGAQLGALVEGDAPTLPLGVRQSLRIRPQDLIDSPYQPRLSYDEGALAELAKSLKMRQIEPVLVRPSTAEPGRYELISGHRRKRASILGEIELLDAWVIDVPDAEARVLVVAANDPREDFSDYERGIAYQAILSDGTMAATHAKLAELVGVDRSLIGKRLDMLRLPSAVLEVLNIYPRCFSHGFVPKLRAIVQQPGVDMDRLKQALIRVATGEIGLSAVHSIMASGHGTPQPDGGVRPNLSLVRGSQAFAHITPHPTKRQVMVKIPGTVDVNEIAKVIYQAISDRFGASPQTDATTPSDAL